MSEQTSIAKAPAKKTSKSLFFAWPTRTIAYAVGSVMMGYVTYYATDILGIPPATVGILFMVSKIFDGISDIIAGYLIDRTHTKWGKGRPYELALIGYWLSIILCFSAPAMGLTASCVYIFVMYTLVNSVFLTLLLCAEPVYLANSLEESSQNVSVLAFSGLISLVFTMASAIILPQLITTMGATRGGWIKLALIMGIPCTLVGMIRFLVVKERTDVAGTSEPIKVRQMIDLLKQNKYILIFSVIIFLSNIGTNLINSVQAYYFTYVMGDLNLLSSFSITTFAIVIVMALAPVLSKKMGFVNLMRATTLLGLFGYLARLFNIHSYTLLFVSNIFAMMGFYTMFSFANTFVIDCMDYGEWKTGVRSEGTVSCAQSVTAKIGTAIGVGLVGVLMGMSGYDGTLAVQPESANMMLIALFSVVPAVFCLIQFILLKVYDLDKYLPQIQKELAERRAKQES